MKKNYTKCEMYEVIKGLVDAGVIAGELTETGITEADVAEFCEKEIALLDKKATKAKERIATKKAEGDELLAAVRQVLSDEDFEPIAEIAARIEGEDVSVAKVTARLKKLIDSGEAVKEQITIPGGEGQKSRKVMAYRRSLAD